MRAATKIDEIALPIERDRRAFRQVANDLALVGLAHRLEQPDRLFARYFAALHGNVGLGQLAHPLLNVAEVVRGKGARIGEVVVETVLDGRADRHLRIRIELLDGHSHQMRAGMAQQGQALRIALGHHGELSVRIDWRGEITEIPIDARRQRAPRQSGANALRDLQGGHRFGKTSLRPVGQGNHGHIVLVGLLDALCRPSKMKHDSHEPRNYGICP